jgi:alkanesulfonate monooxygenase SsuD/methylene tetrahydromethanopterin reductase-like flavin-dependent oxidoreductase (luciferase family)
MATTTTTAIVIHPWVAAGAGRMRFGVEFAPQPDWEATRDLAQTVEALGFDSLWIPDHPGVLASATWTTLAGLAAATSTVRLGPLVACAAYWNPVVLARAAADIDRLSGDRLVLGLGSGDMPHEFARLGIEWPAAAARQARLEETLRMGGPLLRGETVSFVGEHVRAEGAVLDPARAATPRADPGGGRRGADHPAVRRREGRRLQPRRGRLGGRGLHSGGHRAQAGRPGRALRRGRAGHRTRSCARGWCWP